MNHHAILIQPDIDALINYCLTLSPCCPFTFSHWHHDQLRSDSITMLSLYSLTLMPWSTTSWFYHHAVLIHLHIDAIIENYLTLSPCCPYTDLHQCHDQLPPDSITMLSLYSLTLMPWSTTAWLCHNAVLIHPHIDAIVDNCVTPSLCCFYTDSHWCHHQLLPNFITMLSLYSLTLMPSSTDVWLYHHSVLI